MRVIRLSAGLVDAGASSLATFIAGIAATRLLDTAELGLYAVFFFAWFFASQLPTQLVLVPAEAQLVKLPTSKRSAFLQHNIWLALPLAVAASAAVLSVVLVVPAEIPTSDSLKLAATAALVTAVFPLEEHGRRLLHLSRTHWLASGASLVRLAVSTTVLVLGWRAGLAPALLPFGSLATGDLAALLFALLTGGRPQTKAPYSLRDVLRTGRWLVFGASVGPAAGFAVSLVVTSLAGASAMGFAEAARIAGQPILVTAVGVAGVLNPSSMEAAVRGNERRARSLSRRMTFGLLLATVGYLGLISLPAPTNVVESVIPTAFGVPGLVQVSVVAAFFNGTVFLLRAELIALEKGRALSIAEGKASLIRTVVALPAGILGSWVVPIGFMLGGVVRWISFWRLLRPLYELHDTRRELP